MIARAVHDVGSGTREKTDLGVGEEDTVHERHVRAGEPEAVEEFDRSAVVFGLDALDLGRGLRHVRVEPEPVGGRELAGGDVVLGCGLAERDRRQHDPLGAHAVGEQRSDPVEGLGDRLADGVVALRHQASGQVPADAGGLVTGDRGGIKPVAMERVDVVDDRRHPRGHEPGGAVGRHRLVLDRPCGLVQPPVEPEHLVQLQALAGAQPGRHVAQVIVEVDEAGDDDRPRCVHAAPCPAGWASYGDDPTAVDIDIAGRDVASLIAGDA